MESYIGVHACLLAVNLCLCIVQVALGISKGWETALQIVVSGGFLAWALTLLF